MSDDNNISVIIIYSFFFLFVIFLFLQQETLIEKPTGYALFDTDFFDNLSNTSLITLIIVLVALILLIIGGFFIYKKIKNKQQADLEVPRPPQQPEKSLSDLNKEFNIPAKIEEQKIDGQGINVLDQDLNKLFAEAPQEQLPEHKFEQKPILQKNVLETKTEEIKFNIEELKQLLISLMKKNYTRDSIIKYLMGKGYNMMQIKKTIDSINEDNLTNYIENALSQGFSKQEIIRSLLAHGWDKEDIIKNVK